MRETKEKKMFFRNVSTQQYIYTYIYIYIYIYIYEHRKINPNAKIGIYLSFLCK